MSWSTRRRWIAIVAGVATGAVLVLLVVMLVHAQTLRLAANARRAERDRAAIVALVGVPDLAVSSSSRWLRHPSVSEPGAPFADAPATLDTDPAGAAIAPPRALYRGTDRSHFEVRHRVSGGQDPHGSAP